MLSEMEPLLKPASAKVKYIPRYTTVNKTSTNTNRFTGKVKSETRMSRMSGDEGGSVEARGNAVDSRSGYLKRTQRSIGDRKTNGCGGRNGAVSLSNVYYDVINTLGFKVLRFASGNYVMATLSVILCFVILTTEAASTYSIGASGDTNGGTRGRLMQFGVVIDAGSSGSRVRVYGWTYPPGYKGSIPQFAEAYNYKVRPGISAFSSRPHRRRRSPHRPGRDVPAAPPRSLDDLGPYVDELIQKAKDYVPFQQHYDTPIYFMATAGMRLLLEPKADAIMDRINAILQDSTRNPFRYDPQNCRILSGEEEGAFAWMSVNYLRGYFTNTDTMDSVGILEMGGASTQIAFVPDTSVLADKFPVTIGGIRYPLYVHSYLYYGQNYADKWVKEYLEEMNPTSNSIPNPCFLKGDWDDDIMAGRVIRFQGSGSPDKCLEIMADYVYKVAPRRCNPKPCAIGPVYQPTIKSNELFYAVSAFLYSFNTLEIISDNQTFSPAELRAAAVEYCAKDIDVILNESVDLQKLEEYLSDYCLMGLYSYTLFTRGYGFTEHTRQLVATPDINGQSPQWALGAIIYETQRYRPCPTIGMLSSTTARQHSRATPSQTLLFIVTMHLLCVIIHHKH